MSLFGLSTWLVGAANGYTEKEGGLPPSAVYGTVGVASVAGTMNAISKSISAPKTPSLALFLVPPLVAGAVYYVGNQVGTSVRHMSDRSEKST